MRVRRPDGHYPTGRKAGVSQANKFRDKAGYKQSNKKYFHENDGGCCFHSRGVSQNSRGLVEPMLE
jgi:hypothetical protein